MSLASINTSLRAVTGVTSGTTLAGNLAALIGEVGATYTSITEMGGAAPANKNTENMASAIEGII